MIDKYTEQANGCRFFGLPLSEFSIAELKIIIAFLIQEHEDQEQNHSRTLKFMAELKCVD